MDNVTQIIDVTTSDGKDFVQQLESLKKELGVNSKGEKIRQHVTLTPEQIEKNQFLTDFISSEMFKEFKIEVKGVFIGNYGRKVGWTYPPINQEYFRVFVHFGDNEAYYMNNSKMQNKICPLTSGKGIIVSPFLSQETSITVYSDPIRLIHDTKIQEMIPKIRPRNYSRTTLIYDLHFAMESEAADELSSDNSAGVDVADVDN